MWLSIELHRVPLVLSSQLNRFKGAPYGTFLVTEKRPAGSVPIGAKVST